MRRESDGALFAFSFSDSLDPWFVCVNVLSDGNCDFVEGSKPIRPLCLRGTPPPTFRSGLLVLSKLNRIPLPFIV